MWERGRQNEREDKRRGALHVRLVRLEAARAFELLPNDSRLRKHWEKNLVELKLTEFAELKKLKGQSSVNSVRTTSTQYKYPSLVTSEYVTFVNM